MITAEQLPLKFEEIKAKKYKLFKKKSYKFSIF